MVACSHLAHYLRCTDVLDNIVSILQQSLDSAKSKLSVALSTSFSIQGTESGASMTTQSVGYVAVW
jgi:hypothetical protein